MGVGGGRRNRFNIDKEDFIDIDLFKELHKLF
jgi:hypothetical protein